MAGYSGTPLTKNLGLKAGCSLGLWNAPQNLDETLGALPEAVTPRDIARGKGPLDVLVCFVASRAELSRALPKARQRLQPNGGLCAWMIALRNSALAVQQRTS